MMLYLSVNLPALKGKKKHNLPIFWRANRNVWLTASIFMNWFHICLVSQVERYMAVKNLFFKVLLLVDNAPGHTEVLDVAHTNVEVIFLPPNKTFLFQSLDQGVILTF